MGRRVNISQPMVLSTELAALSERFSIICTGSKEQWYYADSATYTPDRSVTPLILRPSIVVFDPDTETRYTASFYSVRWYIMAWYQNAYQEAEITNTVDSTEASYVIEDDGSLIVKENVSTEHSVTLRCEAVYIDPRDSSIRNKVEDTVTLASNRDATAVFPKIDILTEKTVPYNFLSDVSSEKTFTAEVTKGGEVITEDVYVEWYLMDEENNTETLAEEFPCYVSGQGTDTLTLDAMFGDNITVVARVRDTEQSGLHPCKAYRTMYWKIPQIDATAYSENGAAVRNSTESMTFNTIMNIRHSVLSDEQKENFVFHWKMRVMGQTEVTDLGYGTTVTVDGGTLASGSSSVLVWPEVYLLGVKSSVMLGDDTVVYNGNTLISRNKD